MGRTPCVQVGRIRCCRLEMQRGRHRLEMWGRQMLGRGGPTTCPGLMGFSRAQGGRRDPSQVGPSPGRWVRVLPRSAPRPHCWVCPIPPPGRCGLGGQSGGRTPSVRSPALLSTGGKTVGNGSNYPFWLNAHLESYSRESVQGKVVLLCSPSSR